MKLPTRRALWPSFVVLVPVLTQPGAAPASGDGQDAPAGKAAIGQPVPDFTFRDFFAGGDGRQKLAEFRGQPVLIVNWTDTDFGRGAAGEAEDLAKELVPEGLVVVLLETHSKSEQEVEAAVMRLYPGSPARLTVNQSLPIEDLDNGPPPRVALIGVEGTLLVAGSYTADMGKASKLAKAELKRLKSGWGEHDAARSARALAFGEKRLGAAKAALQAALQAEPGQAELTAAQSGIAARFEGCVRSVRFLMEKGQYGLALEQARALAKGVQGDQEWEAQAASLLQEFAGEEAQRELELDKKLNALLAPLSKKAPDREAEKLKKFAAEAGETRVGKRALHVAEVATLAARK